MTLDSRVKQRSKIAVFVQAVIKRPLDGVMISCGNIYEVRFDSAFLHGGLLIDLFKALEQEGRVSTANQDGLPKLHHLAAASQHLTFFQ